MNKTVATYGYQGRPVPDLMRYLIALGAVCLDIRLSPRSHDPQWGGVNLAHRLRTMGLLYAHIPAYGNSNYRTGGPIALANPSAGRALAAAALGQHSVILLCVCRDVTTCHRRTVGLDLMEAGLCREVVHLPAVYETWQPVEAGGV